MPFLSAATAQESRRAERGKAPSTVKATPTPNAASNVTWTPLGGFATHWLDYMSKQPIDRFARVGANIEALLHSTRPKQVRNAVR